MRKERLFQVLAAIVVMMLVTANVFAAGTQEAAGADKKIVVGFANLTDTLDFGKTVKKSILDAAAKEGWEVIALDNERKGLKAIENAQLLATRGVDAFIEFNVDISVAGTIMDIMNEAKIPVVAIDIPHPGAPFFGVNNLQSGRITGAALANKAKDKWGGKVDLLILVENAKAGAEVKKRMTGIEQGVTEIIPVAKENILYVDGEGDLLKAQERVTGVLTANPDKRNILIGTLQDPMGQGSFAAVEASKRQDHVFIASQGAEVPSLANLRGPENCWIGSTAATPEKYGDYIIPIVKKMLAGEKAPEFTYVDHFFVDKSNVDIHYPQK
jgi:ribose transport system substrate-binding protein